MHISEVIQSLDRLGISQIELAHESRLGRWTVTQFIAGRRELSPAEERQMASALQRFAQSREQDVHVLRQAAEAAIA